VLYELGLAVFDAILRVEAPGVDTLSIMAAVDCAGSPSQILDAGSPSQILDAGARSSTGRETGREAGSSALAQSIIRNQGSYK
jgi:hypothetical protein